MTQRFPARVPRIWISACAVIMLTITTAAAAGPALAAEPAASGDQAAGGVEGRDRPGMRGGRQSGAGWIEV